MPGIGLNAICMGTEQFSCYVEGREISWCKFNWNFFLLNLNSVAWNFSARFKFCHMIQVSTSCVAFCLKWVQCFVNMLHLKDLPFMSELYPFAFFWSRDLLWDLRFLS